MFLAALTSGASSTLIAALWAELFGTRHLGAIRSIAFAGQVLASAAAPGLIGLLLDLHVPIETQYWGIVAFAGASMVLLKAISPQLDRIAEEGDLPAQPKEMHV
jgi:MFS family permease